MDEAPSLSSYLVFNTVAKAGNLSQAAKMLTISQPAVSKSLSRLEEILNVKLFIRNSRGVRLTDEGEMLYQHTSSAFESLDKAQNSIKYLAGTGTGHLKVGTSDDLTHHLWAPHLKGFTSQYSNIIFDITCGNNNEIFEGVENGAIDVGFIIRPISLHRLEYIEITTLTETYACSPLYQDSFSALADSQTINLNNMESEIDFALAGMGVVRTYTEFIKEFLDNGTLREVSKDATLSTVSCGLIYNKTSLQQREVQNLINYFQHKDVCQ